MRKGFIYKNNMKFTFYLLVILFPVFAKAQDWKVMVDQPFELKTKDSGISDSEKKELLEKIISFPLFEELQESESLDFGNFHFVNLDNDIHLEVIYYGFAGSESDATILIDNSDDGLKLKGQFLGKIVSVGYPPNRLNKIQIIEHPCCADYVHHLITFIWNEFDSKYQAIEDVAFVTGTDFPTEFTLNDRFETINEGYRLRLNPTIDDKIYDLNARPFDAIGNILAEFSKGAKGKALAERTDETGRIWWFVYFDAKNIPKNSLFHESANHNLSYRYAGWTSSRYLKLNE